ncbi:hypothetical protein V2J09_014698 [Rumex salicifolius]
MDFSNNNIGWEQESSTSPLAASHSDEEIILASSCPKKKAGRKKFKETRHPVYRGVRRRNNNRWVCELRALNNKTRIWLGTYPTAEMAARAHDVAALALRGRMACLNFADSATILPVPASGDIKEIQKAAAEAAEAFRPQEEAHGQVSGEEIRREEEAVQEYNACGYMDEEADLLTHMAEGMLMSPPRHEIEYQSLKIPKLLNIQESTIRKLKQLSNLSESNYTRSTE